MIDNKTSLLIPSCGDPLSLYIWFENYKKYKNLIDDLYISVDFLATYDLQRLFKEKEIINDYLKRFFENQEVNFKINNCVGEHGKNIKQILTSFENNIKENVIISEEDCYIINCELFEKIKNLYLNENYDILATPLNCVLNDSLFNRFFESGIRSRTDLFIKNKCSYPISFWTTYFFIKKRHLYNSSMHFEAKCYNVGDVIEIGTKKYNVTEDFSLDTFRQFSFEQYNNPDVKKIYINDTQVSNLYKKCMHDYVNLNNFMDFHFNGCSVFSSNCFWIKDIYSKSNYLSRIKNNPNFHSLLDWYKTIKVYYKFLLLIDNTKFEFYENYKNNLENILYIIENDHNIIQRMKDEFKDDFKYYGIQDSFLSNLLLKIV